MILLRAAGSKPKLIDTLIFDLFRYQGELVGDDQLIHQDITHSTCFYRNHSCVPKELPNTILAWTSVTHSFNTFRFIGRYYVKSVQSALSDLKRPPERLQSQCNYRPFIT